MVGPGGRVLDGTMRKRVPEHRDAPSTAARRASPPPPSPAPHEGVIELQRTAGNTAVGTLLSDPAGSTVQRTSLAGALAQALAGVRPGGPTVQRDLVKEVRSRVDIMGPPDYNGLLTLIRAAPVADRQAVLADTALMKLIGSRFNRTWATTVASALLEGTHKWKNPVDNDFFNYFVLGTGSGPATPSSTMNCWESVMWAAYLTGAVSAAWIKQFYTDALAQPDANTAAYLQLGWSTALPTYDPAKGRVPTAGQIVFYRTGTSGVPGHMAISMGSGQIMSLWTTPNGVDHIQQVGITEIAGTIYYRDPPW
jgi:hypothetical protein